MTPGWTSQACQKACAQLCYKKNSIILTNKDIICISQLLSKASSGEKPRSSFDRMVTSISCCCICFQDHAVSNVREVEVTELLKNIQKHRLPGNIENRQKTTTATLFTRHASSNECYETFTPVCEELLQKRVSLAVFFFTTVNLYEVLFGEEFCTGLFAFRSRLFFERVQKLDGYYFKYYNANFALPEEVESAATVGKGCLCDVLMTQGLGPGFEGDGDYLKTLCSAYTNPGLVQ